MVFGSFLSLVTRPFLPSNDAGNSTTASDTHEEQTNLGGIRMQLALARWLLFLVEGRWQQNDSTGSAPSDAN